MRFLLPTFENIISLHNQGRNNILVVVRDSYDMAHVVRELQEKVPARMMQRINLLNRIITFNGVDIHFAFRLEHFRGINPDAILSVEENLLPIHVIEERNIRYNVMVRHRSGADFIPIAYNPNRNYERQLQEVQYNGSTHYVGPA